MSHSRVRWRNTAGDLLTAHQVVENGILIDGCIGRGLDHHVDNATGKAERRFVALVNRCLAVPPHLERLVGEVVRAKRAEQAFPRGLVIDEEPQTSCFVLGLHHVDT